MLLERGRVYFTGAVVCLAAASLAHEGRAGIVLANPTVKESGDPDVTYDIGAYLGVNSTLNALSTQPLNPASDDFLTIYDVKGYDGTPGNLLRFTFLPATTNSLTAPQLVLASSQDQGLTPAGLTLGFHDTGLPNYTLALAPGSSALTNNGPDPLFLGTIELSGHIDEDPPTFTFNYAWQVHAPGLTSGYDTVQAATPEPATLGPLVAGLGVVGVCCAARRRRRGAPRG